MVSEFMTSQVIETLMNYLRSAIQASLLGVWVSGCAMEPAYLGYEVNLEEESSTGQDESDASDSSEAQDETFPQEPDLELTKRQCRKLARRYYSECRENCEEDEYECRERCEREARDFLRACLRSAKPSVEPKEPGGFENASALDKSKDFLKSESDPNA